MFVELCRGLEHFLFQWGRFLSMLSCVVLTVLEKVSITEFAYLVRSCIELRRGVKF